jgi:glycine betaine/proline transport system substrate-binding protein
MNRQRKFILGLLVGLLITVLAACAAPLAPQSAGPATDASPPAQTSDSKPVIKLAENPWSASQLNVAVAKILLEEKLGYQVEVVSIDENAQWPALASGDLHASLEVWPSGHAENVAEYIDKQQLVENGGSLGVVGKIGWYIPTYLLTDHPELATWEGFTTPESAALFATAETGDQGQFLAGDPSWVQYDADIMKNLGIPFQIVNAGSEEAILAALDSANSRQEPIIFYFWTPHSVHAKYDLTEVKLPDYSDECYAKAAEGGVACDYPADNLFKVFWAGLKDAAPDAYSLLQKMNYSTADQISMIAAVELDGKSVDDAARAWIDANETTWSVWLEQ